MDQRALRDVFSAFPSGVVVVCARVSGELVGMTVSTFIPVSLDPPLVAISVRKESSTWPTLARSSELGVAVLGSGHEDLARQIASPVGDRFRGLDMVVDTRGAAWPSDAPVVMTCAPAELFEAGDHFLATLSLRTVVRHSAADPLVFHNRQMRPLRSDSCEPALAALR